jgi:hypothetical protein
MKRIEFISILMGLGIIAMNAQYSIKWKMINPTSVTMITDSSLTVKGALYQAKNSSVLISSSTRKKDYTMGNSNFIISEIEITDIQLIETRNRTRVRNGALIGAATGFLIGAMWTFIESQQPSKGWDMAPEFPGWWPPLAGGMLIAPIGAVAGSIAGSIYIKIPINGSKVKYDLNKPKLTKYAIMNDASQRLPEKE